MIRYANPLLVCVLALAASPLAGCISLPPSLFGSVRGPVQLETVTPAQRAFTRNEILVLDLTGVISMSDERGLFNQSSSTVVQITDRLKAAEENGHIKAVILRIDSPGGGVTASDVIYHEILSFKAKSKVPVIAIMQDVAASGGLYAAMAADEVYAMPTTVTGSIGVITILPGLQKMSDKIGLEMRVIKSGKNKDLGSPWRSLTDEEKKIFQSMIDRMYDRFLSVIIEGRSKKGLTREKLLEFADGRVLDPYEAQKLGLIDGVFYLDEAVKRAKEIAGVTDAAIVSYEYPGAYRGNIYASSPFVKSGPGLGPVELNLLGMDFGLNARLPSDTRFLYMWLP